MGITKLPGANKPAPTAAELRQHSLLFLISI